MIAVHAQHITMDNLPPKPQQFIQQPHQLSPFSLGENDVVCGSNRLYNFHSGNKRFRKIVAQNLKKYREASKAGKSTIISAIVNFIRKTSPNGGFVQKDPLSGCYVEVGDSHAVCK